MPKIVCSVKDCLSSKEDPNERFFHFPRTKEMCEEWVAFCCSRKVRDLFGAGDPRALSHKKVCSKHFPNSAYQNSLKLKLLRGVVPSLKAPVPSHTENYKVAVQQVTEEQTSITEPICGLSALESERDMTREQIAELWTRLEAVLENGEKYDLSSSLAQHQLVLKARDIESRLELEQTKRTHMESFKNPKEAVQQLPREQSPMTHPVDEPIESDRDMPREQVAEIWVKLEDARRCSVKAGPDASLAQQQLMLKAKDLELSLKMEQEKCARMEVQLKRLKEESEKSKSEAKAAREREQEFLMSLRRARCSAKEAWEKAATAAAREAEAVAKKEAAEQRAMVVEAKEATTQAELKQALARLEELQAVVMGEKVGIVISGGQEDEPKSHALPYLRMEARDHTLIMKESLPHSKWATREETAAVSVHEAEVVSKNKEGEQKVTVTETEVAATMYKQEPSIGMAETSRQRL